MICIGLPIHNGARYLRHALDSLRAQSRGDYRLVLLDDGSVDGSDSIAWEYAERDSRIHFVRNESRSGLINAWKRVAEIAAHAYGPRYFAWFADHDWVASDWLERLAQALHDQPGAVLTHARTVHVDVDGVPIGTESHNLDTTALGPYERLRAVTLETFGAGDAVYGLFSFDALCRCGTFPAEILPDRLLISELSLCGTIKHVPGAVRFRRVFPPEHSPDMIRRQLRTLSVPAEQRLRPHLSHATYFMRRFVNAPADEPPAQRMRRLYHSLLYFQHQFNKYRRECLRELELPEPFGELSFLVDFLEAVRERKWKFLYQDYAALAQRVRETDARVQGLKTLRDRLEKKLAECEEKLAEREEKLAECEEKLTEREAQIAILSDELRHPVRHLLRSVTKGLRP
jgi:glycosyltransferase involved in cell wall biosynthesis